MADVGCELLAPGDIGLELDVPEDGTTFQENAAYKALVYADTSGLPSLADDSGIEVDALDGGPGVYSARYGGPALSHEDRTQLLLQEMSNVEWEERGCQYAAAVALAWPDGYVEVFEGSCPGVIALAPVGSNGFGYDPVFYIPELGRTIAELSDEGKDAISHRGQAARDVASFLRQLAQVDRRDRG